MPAQMACPRTVPPFRASRSLGTSWLGELSGEETQPSPLLPTGLHTELQARVQRFKPTRWARVPGSLPVKEGGGSQGPRRRSTRKVKVRAAHCCFEDRGRGHELRDVGSPSKLEKARTSLSPTPREGTQASDTWIFAPWARQNPDFRTPRS